MANRVLDADVRAIRPSTVITDYDPYITAANVVVNGLVTSCGSTFSDELLTEIEKFLAAHIAGATDPKLTEEKFENASRKFERGGSSGMGILSTQYGQTANMLSGGCLMRQDMQPAVAQFA